jgi:hypothetical protein
MNWNPYLIGNMYLGNTDYLNTFSFWFVLGAIIVTLFTIITWIKSGSGYSVEDTEAHATRFGGTIREGHGGMTFFLSALLIFLFVWTIVYFIQNAVEFSIWFAY